MKLSRHARNRLRWIQRAHDAVSERDLIEAFPEGHTLGYDERGHRKVLIAVGSTRIVLVIDEEVGLVITLWTR